MESKVFIKDRLVLLIILSLAAGFLFLLPVDKNKQNKTIDTLSKNKEKDEKNIINCSNDFDISLINSDQKIKTAPNTCLFIGCGGINF